MTGNEIRNPCGRCQVRESRAQFACTGSAELLGLFALNRAQGFQMLVGKGKVQSTPRIRFML